VTQVHDGDTLRMIVGGEVVKIRLAHIDAPEMKQRHGPESKLSLEELTRDETVDATCTKKDLYGRFLCTLFVGPKNINSALVEQGAAWVYLAYAPKRTPLIDVQADAKSSHRGLWADAEATPPWDYRRNLKGAP
jgi:micrococcal nuclease